MTAEKNSNALKHGAFTEAVLLPKDDPKKFDELHASLIEEWEPDGPSERDKVLSVAINMWRKRRFRRWLQDGINDIESTVRLRERWRDKQDLRLLDFLDEYSSGIFFSEDELEKRLFPKAAQHLKKVVPRKSFNNDADWRKAVEREIFKVLEARPQTPDLQKIYADEPLAERELAFEERIDAKIARDLKELGQIKTMKAIGLGKRRASAPADDLKIVPSPPIMVQTPDSSGRKSASGDSPSTEDVKEE